MRYIALAAGYDGTLAREGHCSEACIEALRALAATGRKLILVTGRELRDLLEVFPEARVFDYLVAENGAVMHRPATRASAILAQAPPEILLQELRRRRVNPLTVGNAIVSAPLEFEDEVRQTVDRLQLDARIATTQAAVILLPVDVNKAFGIRAVLKELGLSPHNLVAIGDADDDVAMLGVAEYAVAVQNATSTVKACADRVTQGADCDGFIELARDLMTTDLANSQSKHRIVLGALSQHSLASIEPCRHAVLVCGPMDSGKAALCTSVLQQMLREKYQCIVIGADVNGSYALLPGIHVFGDSHDAPRLTDVLDALEQPASSVAVNLAALPMDTRPVFVDALLLQLQALHDRVGRPHAIVIDQAHCFFAGSAAPHPAPRLADVTMVYSSSDPEHLPRQILENIDLFVALEMQPDELQQLCQLTETLDPHFHTLQLPRGVGLLWTRHRQPEPDLDAPMTGTAESDDRRHRSSEPEFSA